MQIAFFLYENVTALDVVGPHEILSRLPNATTRRVAVKAGPILTDSGLVLHADAALEDVSSADILVVPGAGRAISFKNDPKVLEWIQKIHATTTWTTSVCTGSLILGAAGILKGLNATTHWSAFERLAEWEAMPTHERIVEAGKVITAAGVSAGIDMALTLASKIISPEFAQSMQLAIEYDPMPPFDTGSPKKAPVILLERLRERMVASFVKE